MAGLRTSLIGPSTPGIEDPSAPQNALAPLPYNPVVAQAPANSFGFARGLEAGIRNATLGAEVDQMYGDAYAQELLGNTKEAQILRGKAVLKEDAQGYSYVPDFASSVANINSDKGIGGYVGHMVGSAYGSVADQAPAIIGGLAARALVGGPVGAALGLATVGQHQARMHLGGEARKFREKYPDEDPSMAPVYAALAKTAPELLSNISHLRTAKAAAGNRVSPLRTMRDAALPEGLEETFQTGVDDVTARIMGYDHVPGATEYVDSFLAGTIGGVGVAAPAAGINAGRNALGDRGQAIREATQQRVTNARDQFTSAFSKDGSIWDMVQRFTNPQAAETQQTVDPAQTPSQQNQGPTVTSQSAQYDPSRAAYRDDYDPETPAGQFFDFVEGIQSVQGKATLQDMNEFARDLKEQHAQLDPADPQYEAATIALKNVIDDARIRAEDEGLLPGALVSKDQQAELNRAMDLQDSAADLMDRISTEGKSSSPWLQARIKGKSNRSLARIQMDGVLAQHIEYFMENPTLENAKGLLQTMKEMQQQPASRYSRVLPIAADLMKSVGYGKYKALQDAGFDPNAVGSQRVETVSEEDLNDQLFDEQDAYDAEVTNYDTDALSVEEQSVTSYHGNPKNSHRPFSAKEGSLLRHELKRLQDKDPNGIYEESTVLEDITAQLDKDRVALQTRDQLLIDKAQTFDPSVSSREAAENVLSQQKVIRRLPVRTDSEKGYATHAPIPERNVLQEQDPNVRAKRLTQIDTLTEQAKEILGAFPGSPAPSELLNAYGPGENADVDRLREIYSERYNLIESNKGIVIEGDASALHPSIYAPAIDNKGNPRSINIQHAVRSASSSAHGHPIEDTTVENTDFINKQLSGVLARLSKDYGVDITKDSLPDYLTVVTKRWGDNIRMIDLRLPTANESTKLREVDRKIAELKRDPSYEQGAQPLAITKQLQALTELREELAGRIAKGQGKNFSKKQRAPKRPSEGVNPFDEGFTGLEAATEIDARLDELGDSLERELDQSIAAAREGLRGGSSMDVIAKLTEDLQKGKPVIETVNTAIKGIADSFASLSTLRVKQSKKIEKFRQELALRGYAKLVQLKLELGLNPKQKIAWRQLEKELDVAGALPPKVVALVREMKELRELIDSPEKKLFGGSRTIAQVEENLTELEDLYVRYHGDPVAKIEAYGGFSEQPPEFIVAYELDEGQRKMSQDEDSLEFLFSKQNSYIRNSSGVEGSESEGQNKPREYLEREGRRTDRAENVKGDEAVEQGERKRELKLKQLQRRRMATRILESVWLGPLDSRRLSDQGKQFDYNFAHNFADVKDKLEEQMRYNGMSHLWDANPDVLRRNLENFTGRRVDDIVLHRKAAKNPETAPDVVGDISQSYMEQLIGKYDVPKIEQIIKGTKYYDKLQKAPPLDAAAMARLHKGILNDFGAVLDNTYLTSASDLHRLLVLDALNRGVAPAKIDAALDKVIHRARGYNLTITLNGKSASFVSVFPGKDPASSLETYLHEIGHIVYERLFKDPTVLAEELGLSPKEVKSELNKLYRAWSKNNKTGHLLEQMRFMPFTHEKMLTLAKTYPSYEADLKADNYYLDRGEFMADMVGRYLFTEPRNHSVIRTFFRAIADKLHALMKRLGWANKGVNQTVKSYLDGYLKSVRAKRADAAVETTREVINAQKLDFLSDEKGAFDKIKKMDRLIETLSTPKIKELYDKLSTADKHELSDALWKDVSIESVKLATQQLINIAEGRQIATDMQRVLNILPSLTANVFETVAQTRQNPDVKALMRAMGAKGHTYTAYAALAVESDLMSPLRDSYLGALQAALVKVAEGPLNTTEAPVDQTAVDAQPRDPYTPKNVQRDTTAPAAEPAPAQASTAPPAEPAPAQASASPATEPTSAAEPTPAPPKSRPRKAKGRKKEPGIAPTPPSRDAIEEAAGLLNLTNQQAHNNKLKDMTPADFMDMLIGAKGHGHLMPELLGDALFKVLTGKEFTVLYNRSASPHVRRQIRRIYKDDPKILARLQDDPKYSIGMMYVLNELGSINLALRETRIDDEARPLRLAAEKAVGIASESTQFEKLFEAIQNGRIAQRAIHDDKGIFELPSDVRETTLQRSVLATRDFLIKARDKVFNPILAPVQSRLNQTENAFLINLMAQINASAISENQELSYEESIPIATRRFRGMFAAALEGNITDTDFMEKFGEALVSPSAFATADKEVKQAIKNVRANLLPALTKYLQRAGVPVNGDKINDVPWAMDINKLGQDRDGFIELLQSDNMRPGLEKFQQDLEEARYQYYKNNKKMLEQRARELARKRTPSLADLPSYIYDQVMENNGMADMISEHYDLHNPSFKPYNNHNLDFVMRLATTAQREQISGYLNTNGGEVMMNFLHQAIERAEFSRRWGAYGEKLQSTLSDAKLSGATDKQLKLATDALAAAQNRYGRDTKELLDAFLEKTPLSRSIKDKLQEGRTISPTLQSTMGWAVVYENWRILGLSPFMAIGDLGGIASRGGSLRGMLSGIKAAFQSIGKNADTNDLKSLGETLHLLDQSLMYDALASRYMGTPETRRQRQANDLLFTINGMKWVTDFNRRASLVAAQQFLKRHVQEPKSNSEQMLGELGVFAEDIKFGAKGNVVLLSEDEMDTATDAALAADARVRTALHRFVNQSVVVPNASVKPLYMSDPHFQLITHLKPFIYAMHENFTLRFAKGVLDYNFAPVLLAYATYLPILAMSGEAREFIQYGPSGNPQRQNWDVFDHLQYARERAGLEGYVSAFLGDASRDREFGGVGIESALAPTLNHVLNPSSDWVSYMPLQNVYKNHLR